MVLSLGLTKTQGKYSGYTVMFALWLGGAGSAPAAVALPPLAEPLKNQSLETIERRVVAVGLAPSGLVLAAEQVQFVITSPFKKEAETREAIFGKLIDSKRMMVGDKSERFDWRAFFPFENRVMAFDGTKMMLMEVDSTSYNEVIRRSIPWDQLKPPRDRGGEGTTREISAFRSSFKKAMLAMKGTKVSGMAKLPDNWFKNGKTNYLLLSRLKDFPLLLLECSTSSASECMLSRGCNLERFTGSPIETLRGIAVSSERQQIFIGDPVQKKLHVLKFNTCNQVVGLGSRVLPQSLKPLSNILVDQDDRLFVTTESPDDYLNASLYFWNKSQW